MIALRHVAGVRENEVLGADAAECCLGRNVEPTTAATWLMQRGVAAWQAAGYLSMSTEMIERIYGQHSPEHLRKAAKATPARPIVFLWSSARMPT